MTALRIFHSRLILRRELTEILDICITGKDTLSTRVLGLGFAAIYPRREIYNLVKNWQIGFFWYCIPFFLFEAKFPI